jgi:hypothetical protein
LLTGFLFSLWGTENLPGGVFELLGQIWRHEPIRDELVQLLGLLEERAAHLSFPIEQELRWAHPVPLSVHSRYALDEVVAAFGRSTLEKPYRLREGVMFDAATQSDVFFVTLEKSEARYSPTTMYKDYAISPVLFHWESQSVTGEGSATRQRYIHHRARGTHVLLFGRRSRTEAGRTAACTFLGPADYVSHRGERPMGITWRLRRPMPADFFREAKVAAAGGRLPCVVLPTMLPSSDRPGTNVASSPPDRHARTSARMKAGGRRRAAGNPGKPRVDAGADGGAAGHGSCSRGFSGRAQYADPATG